MVVAALAVFALVVTRACLQSATIDETAAYLGYCAPTWPSHFYPTSGNHVLNSVVVRLMSTVFGLSHLTLRSGALVGAAIYLVSCYRLTVAFAEAAWLRWPLFLSLTINPFILDFLVASRGYSLALGLLMAALAVLLPAVLESGVQAGAGIVRRCAMASLFAGLSFCANFAFAWIDLSVIALFLLWAVKNKAARWYSLAAAAALPGAAVTLAFCGSVLHEWPQGLLVYGSSNLREMWDTLVDSSLYQLNDFMVNPLLKPLMLYAGLVLPYVFCGVGLLLAARAIVNVLLASDERRRRRALACSYLLSVLAITLTLHWIARRAFHILLPRDRTGIFFVALTTLLFGLAVSVRSTGRGGRLLSGAGAAVLMLSSVYYAGCLRLSYFKEWRFDAEARNVYEVLLDLNRQRGIHDVVSGWEYSTTLNFYQLLYRHPGLFLFQEVSTPPPGKPVYVLGYTDNREFLEKQGLQVVYHGQLSDVAVAVEQAVP